MRFPNLNRLLPCILDRLRLHLIVRISHRLSARRNYKVLQISRIRILTYFHVAIVDERRAHVEKNEHGEYSVAIHQPLQRGEDRRSEGGR